MILNLPQHSTKFDGLHILMFRIYQFFCGLGSVGGGHGVPASDLSVLKVQSFSIPYNFVTLPELLAFGGEFVRCCGIELKKIVMTGNNTGRADIIGQASRLRTVKVASDAPLRSVAVDGKQGEVDLKAVQRGHEFWMKERIAA